jgi:hypothetical protein
MNRPKDAKPDARFVAIPLTAIMSIPRSKLSFAAKCLYGLLRLHGHLPADPTIDGVQGPCYPGEDTLARELGVSERYVRDVLDELRDSGLISWKRTGRSNRYQVFPPGSFRISDRKIPSGAVDRKKGPAQNGRKVPVRSDERSRSDRKDSSDKKTINRAPSKEAAGRSGTAAQQSINIGDLNLYTVVYEGE